MSESRVRELECPSPCPCPLNACVAAGVKSAQLAALQRFKVKGGRSESHRDSALNSLETAWVLPVLGPRRVLSMTRKAPATRQGQQMSKCPRSAARCCVKTPLQDNAPECWSPPWCCLTPQLRVPRSYRPRTYREDGGQGLHSPCAQGDVGDLLRRDPGCPEDAVGVEPDLQPSKENRRSMQRMNKQWKSVCVCAFPRSEEIDLEKLDVGVSLHISLYKTKAIGRSL